MKLLVLGAVPHRLILSPLSFLLQFYLTFATGQIAAMVVDYWGKGRPPLFEVNLKLVGMNCDLSHYSGPRQLGFGCTIPVDHVRVRTGSAFCLTDHSFAPRRGLDLGVLDVSVPEGASHVYIESSVLDPVNFLVYLLHFKMKGYPDLAKCWNTIANNVGILYMLPRNCTSVTFYVTQNVSEVSDMQIFDMKGI